MVTLNAFNLKYVCQSDNCLLEKNNYSKRKQNATLPFFLPVTAVIAIFMTKQELKWFVLYYWTSQKLSNPTLDNQRTCFFKIGFCMSSQANNSVSSLLNRRH